ncbi:MAG: hypothetical protein LBB48_04585 [Treponema sp.]|nr:hypothetical protein [Treponema sp.]
MSNAQREDAGVTVRDGMCATIHDPKTHPEFSFKVLDLMRIQIDFRDQGSAPYPTGTMGRCFAT